LAEAKTGYAFDTTANKPSAFSCARRSYAPGGLFSVEKIGPAFSQNRFYNVLRAQFFC
jgi:hypothetical protein